MLWTPGDPPLRLQLDDDPVDPALARDPERVLDLVIAGREAVLGDVGADEIQALALLRGHGRTPSNRGDGGSQNARCSGQRSRTENTQAANASASSLASLSPWP